MNGFWNLVHEHALSSGLPDDTLLPIAIQWKPGIDDIFNEAYVPPREYEATVAELKALPVVSEPPPPVQHDPNAIHVTLTADKNVRERPTNTSKLIRSLKRGNEAWVIGAKQNNYMQFEDKSGWLYVAGLAIASSAPIPPPPQPTPHITTFGWGDHLMPGGKVTANREVYKAVSDIGLLIAAYGVNRNAVFIYRTYYDGQTQERFLREIESDVPGAYNRWYRDHEGLLQKYPFIYFEGYNEVGAPDHYLAFEKYRIEKLAEINRRACVLNIASGNTDAGMWKRAHGMVQAAIQHNAIIGTHCYAEGVMSANCNDSYWREDGQWSGGELFPAVIDPDKAHAALRIIRDKRDLARQGQGAAVLVATELGLDDMSFPGNGIFKPFGIKTRGWRSCVQVWQRAGWLQGTTDTKFYRDQLEWWAKVTGCLGTVYTNGTSGDSTWDDYNVAEVL